MLKSFVVISIAFILTLCNCSSYNAIRPSKTSDSYLISLCTKDLHLSDIHSDSTGIKAIDTVSGWKIWIIKENDNSIKFTSLFAVKEGVPENSILNLCNKANDTRSFVKFSMLPTSSTLFHNALWVQADFFYDKNLDPQSFKANFERFRAIAASELLHNFVGYVR